MATLTQENTFLGLDSGMKAALITSVIVHMCVFVGSIVGLPFLKKDIPNIVAIPITIEMVNIDKKTQTPTPAPPQEKPQAPKMVEETPPDLTPKPPEEQLKEPEKVPDPVKKPEPPVKKEKPKEQKKPKPKPKKEITKAEKPKPKKDFSSVLKNLTPDAADKPAPPRMLTDTKKEGQDAPVGLKMSISELEAIQRMIYPCWNIPSGAKYAENLQVKIKMFMNPDATIRDAVIVNGAFVNSDPTYRAAAESALRAVRNPRCSPLPLPLNKYDQWKTIIMNFDPRGVL